MLVQVLFPLVGLLDLAFEEDLGLFEVHGELGVLEFEFLVFFAEFFEVVAGFGLFLMGGDVLG